MERHNTAPKGQPTFLVHQSKKEAKKLLKLALANAGVISIGNLAEAQELIAQLKGKPHWRALLKDAPTRQSGSFLVGLSIDDKPFTLSREQMSMGTLMVGAPDSGLPLVLERVAREAIEDGCGLVYFSPRGTDDVAFSVREAAEKCGRLQDVHVLDFANAGHKSIGDTWNPFQTMDAKELTKMLSEGITSSEKADHGMWIGRSVAMIAPILAALVWLRDNQDLALNPKVVRESITLEGMISLLDKDFPEEILQGLRANLKSVFWIEELGLKQPAQVWEQHGFGTMYWTTILGAWADTYDHIFMAGNSRINLPAILESGKILVVSLPNLERSPAELAIHARAALSAIASAVAAGCSSKALTRVIIEDYENYPCVSMRELLTRDADSIANIQCIVSSPNNGALIDEDKTAKFIERRCRNQVLMRFQSQDTLRQGSRLYKGTLDLQEEDAYVVIDGKVTERLWSCIKPE